MTTIKLKNGSGAPDAADLVQGEVALDLTNKRIYSENASGTVIEMGTSPSTIDINAGTIDGVTMATSDITVGAGKTLDVSAGTLTLANDQISGDKIQGGTIGSVTISTLTATSADINGGTIDGATIGGASAGAGTFTTLTGSGDMNIDSGTLFVDVSENRVGIGTTSPDVKLVINDPSVAFGTTGSIKINGQQTNQAEGSEISSVIFGSGASSGSAGSKIATVKGSNNQRDSLVFYTGGTTLAEYLRIAYNGDISFYEDTGTTAKLFWDASEESLGIRSTTPGSNANFEVIGDTSVGTGGATIRVGQDGTTDGSANTGSAVLFAGHDGSVQRDFARIAGLKENGTSGNYASYLTLSTRANGGSITERLRLDSSGNLGLGVTPSAWSVNYKAIQSGNGSAFAGFSGNDQTFVVSNAYNDGAWKYKNSAGAGRYTIQGVSNGVHAWFTAPSGTAGNAITFTQAMTLDASGNLMVGKTAIGVTTEGAEVRNDGLIAAGRDLTGSSGSVLYLNRIGVTDGPIQTFYKAGTTVGVIGVNGGVRPYFARPTKAGITIGGASALEPTTDDGTANDGGMDLGGAGARFKDLYLSGSVYLGGTTSANALDDYEEGEADVTFSPETSGTITVNTSVNRIAYTKIGRKVTITGSLQVLSVATPVGSFFQINNLPFVSADFNRFCRQSVRIYNI
jgi:hypothetical protein